MSTLYVIDIDGTIANASRRFAKAGAEPSRHDRAVYDAWVRAVQDERSLLEDEPVPGMIGFVRALISEYYNKVVYVTSREEKWRDVTMTWLSNNEFPVLPLVMRDNDDYSEGADYKETSIKFLKNLYDCNTVVVVDDDEKGTIEEKCHSNSWTFLKAKSGGNK
jgi:phosphatidate phosphatase APP1